LKDAVRFALRYGSIIEEAPLQTYAAALVFCPTNSKVKSQYREEMPSFVEDVAGIDETWDSCLQTLKGYANSVAFSPDSRTLASSSYDQAICLLDTVTGRVKRRLVHNSFSKSVAFAPDGRTLASVLGDGTVQLWDVATGQEMQALEGDANSVAFSPDSRMLSSASSDRTVQLWDVATGQVTQNLEGHSGQVYSVAFSPDGQTLASASQDGAVHLWDIEACRIRQTLKSCSSFKSLRFLAGDPVNGIAFSPDGRTLASAPGGGTLQLWDVATGQVTQNLEGHSGQAHSVAFSPDGQMLASTSFDYVVRLWDVATCQVIQVLGHSQRVNGIAFSPDGQTLASASFDAVQLWDMGASQVTYTTQNLKGHSRDVGSVAYSPDGRMLASGSYNGAVRLWDLATGQATQTLKSSPLWRKKPLSVLSIAFSPDSRILASNLVDGRVQLWNTVTGQEMQTLESNDKASELMSMAFSPDSRMLSVALWDGMIWLRDVATGREMQTLKGYDRGVFGVAFSPDGRTLASGLWNGMIQLWDVATGQVTQTLKDDSQSVKLESMASLLRGPPKALLARNKIVTFSPDGQTLASAGRDRLIKFWDVATGQLTGWKDVDDGWRLESVAFSPDGRMLVSASWDGTVRLWDVAIGRAMRTLSGFDVGPAISYFRFVKAGRLHTNLGTFHIQPTESSTAETVASPDHSSSLLQPIGYGLNRNREWITYDGENVLRLPPEYRVTSSATSGSRIAIGCSSGRVLVLRFSGDNPISKPG